MRHNKPAILFFAMCLLVALNSPALTRSSKVIDFKDATSVASPPEIDTVNEDMLQLARSAGEGAGRLKKMGAYCYRAVKQIVADAFGKDLNCIRSILNEGSAYEAGEDLEQMGFVNDSSKCKTPGAIRVYKGQKIPGIRRLAGDIHGHVEVVGDEGMYHSSFSSALPLDESMRPPGRRILTGCYVPDEKAIDNGPAARCPPSKKSLKSSPAPKKRQDGAI